MNSTHIFGHSMSGIYFSRTCLGNQWMRQSPRARIKPSCAGAQGREINPAALESCVLWVVDKNATVIEGHLPGRTGEAASHATSSTVGPPPSVAPIQPPLPLCNESAIIVLRTLIPMQPCPFFVYPCSGTRTMDRRGLFFGRGTKNNVLPLHTRQICLD